MSTRSKAPPLRCGHDRGRSGKKRAESAAQGGKQGRRAARANCEQSRVGAAEDGGCPTWRARRGSHRRCPWRGCRPACRPPCAARRAPPSAPRPPAPCESASPPARSAARAARSCGDAAARTAGQRACGSSRRPWRGPRAQLWRSCRSPGSCAAPRRTGRSTPAAARAGTRWSRRRRRACARASCARARAAPTKEREREREKRGEGSASTDSEAGLAPARQYEHQTTGSQPRAPGSYEYNKSSSAASTTVPRASTVPGIPLQTEPAGS